MTVIAAGVAPDGTTIMAADTQHELDGRIFHDNRKILTIHPGGVPTSRPVLLGFAGWSQVGDLCSTHLTIGPPPEGDAGMRDWVQGIAEAIAKIAAEATPPAVDSNGFVPAAALLAWHGNLWLVGGNQCAIRIHDGYAAIGSGAELATGYLAAVTGLPTVEFTGSVMRRALVDAVHVACQYDPGCSVDPRLSVQVEETDA